ncbi:RhoGAP-domain-containing protein [Abortiporus biennis]
MSNSADQSRRYKQQQYGSPPNQSALAYMADSDYSSDHTNPSSPPRNGPPMSQLPPISQPHPDRPNFPARASTAPSAPEYDQKKLKSTDQQHHSRSEDLNHSSSLSGSANDLLQSSSSSNIQQSSGASKSQPFLSATRSTSPASSSNYNHPSSSGHSDSSTRRRPRSVASENSLSSETSGTTGQEAPTPASTAHTAASSTALAGPCIACGLPMQGGPFVRALGSLYHLDCFKCMDCATVVASKFFPIDGPDGRQHPLCERDYFRRLNLICAKCDQALRGSYITACNKKFHVEHFTCSVCTTLFGPQDSYYEHDGDVYCHFHYSTRFATKCAGCNSAILKQFVEINRNMRDECWHPECYMINKFWNVKVVTRRPNSGLLPSESGEGEHGEPPYLEEERKETPTSLKEKQIRMEQQVYRIWTVLSAFEESSAACISDMLRQVSNGQYLEAIRMAEKFILHVEVLFATIDDLEWHFARLNLKGMSHVREARMLCRKTVDLFTLLSHTQETGSRRIGMTQELLALVTGLAHYLKILIRIALTGALKLEREQGVGEAISSFLDKLHMLAIQGGDPSAKRMMKRVNGETTNYTVDTYYDGGSGNSSTQGVTYGFRSLAPENAGESPFSNAPRDPALAKVNVVNPPTDWCAKCKGTVEEDCVRLGTFQRWHSHCIQCVTCGKAAAVPVPREPKAVEGADRDRDRSGGEDRDRSDPPKLSTARRPPANVRLFVYEVDSMKDTPEFGRIPTVIFCTDHAHAGCRGGFQSVSRLEQYAFLLNVALRRLYTLLKNRGVVPATPSPAPQNSDSDYPRDPYRDSTEINRLKSVHLDRKLSATARTPKRSTIVESPTGKVAYSSDSAQREVRHAHHAQSNRLHKPPPQQYPQQQQQQQQYPSPSQAQAYPSRPRIQPPGTIDFDGPNGQILRPSFARNNTEVMIVDDSAPTSPAGEEPRLPVDDGITLADIPQIVEAAQAREQHRSLPRQSSIPYIAELSTLELAIVKHAAVLVLAKSPLKDTFDLDEILELVEMKKASFLKRLFGNDKKNQKKKAGVFGVPLEILVEREGTDSSHGASRTATLRVPSFIEDVVSAMRQMDMSVEGIFRKNGNIRRLKELTDSIDRDPSSVDLSQDNPVQLAALLKKFLRELPDPLMTFKLHRLWIATQGLPNEADRKRFLHMVSLILPKQHRDTLEVLFVFLKWVASFAHIDKETGSKMDLPNLATVICPSILYSRGRDAVRDDSFGAIRVVTALLENQDEYYCIPEEFMGILHDQDYFANSLDLPSKEFMKKCDTYMRMKASGRNPGLMSPVLGGSGGTSPFGTPRMEEVRPMPSRAAHPYPQNQLLDRPPLTSSASESQIRSGQSRRPSPPRSGQTQFYSQNGPSSQPMSYGSSAIQSPQPRPPNGYPMNGNGEWNDRPPPIGGQMPNRPSSRPTSTSFTSRPSGDGAHPFTPNGHAPSPAVRQRI